MNRDRCAIFPKAQQAWGGGAWEGELPQWGRSYLPEREVLITDRYEVWLKREGPVSLGEPAGVEKLPTRAGIYFIYVEGILWYVGKATSIRGRFKDRMKTFHDFQIASSSYMRWLKKVKVEWYLITRHSGPKASIKVREKRSKGPWRTISPSLGLLRALEQHFIRRAKRTGAAKGNETSEPVKAEGSGKIIITYEDGRSEILSGVIMP